MFAPIIKDIDHLKQIIKSYGKYVFLDITIMDEMIKFIIDHFIIKNDAEDYIKIFIELFINNFYNRKIINPSNKMREIGSGSFGIIYSYTDTKLMKFIKNDTDGSILIDLSHKRTLKEIMFEFCTFVITMSILLFIDCGKIMDTNGDTIEQSKIYQTYEEKNNIVRLADLSYSSFFAEICKPFINIIITEKNETKYMIGYVMMKYDKTLKMIFNKITKEYVHESFNLFYKTIKIFEKMSFLNDYGILISHRDNTTNNIMYSMRNNVNIIKLIDFGFMCINITFANGTKNTIIGSHSYNDRYDLDKCNKKYVDIILFLSWMLMIENQFFITLDNFLDNKLQIYERLRKITSLNNTHIFKLLENKTKPWDFSADLLNHVGDNTIIDSTLSKLPKDVDKYTDWIFFELHRLLNLIYTELENPNLETYSYNKRKLLDSITHI